MPALFVPTLDALRLALASGLVPGAAAPSPGRAGRDPHGHLWLEPDEPPARDAVAALARLGVIALGSPGVPTEPVRCWAELLPLRRADAPAPGPLLFDVPDRDLAPLVARLRRSGAEVGVRLLPEPHAGRAWATARAPAPLIVARAEEPDSAARVYRQQTANVWVARGWEHPLASHLVAPPDGVLLCAADGAVVSVAAAVPEPRADEFALTTGAPVPHPADPLPHFDVRFRLARSDGPHDETLWVLGPAEEDAFRSFCESSEERLLQRFQVAPVGAGDAARVLVRRANPADGAAVLPILAPGFGPDPRLAGLFVPTGFALRPLVRARELARALAVEANHVVWVEPAGRGVAVHTVAASAFRPLCEQVEYTAPRALPLVPDLLPEESFPFARVALQLESNIELEPEPEPVVPLAEPLPEPVDDPAYEPGWVSRSVSRLKVWLRGHRAAPEPVLPIIPMSDGDEGPEQRVERKLASTDALVHGHDRAARRHEIESRLLADFPTLGADQRAARWAELAGVYGATGQALDAAVCWTNALWECATPPEAWLEQWAVAEVRAAKRPDRGADLDRWLSEPGRPGAGRVVAALTAYFGFQQTPPPEFVSSLPRVFAVLDQQFDDVPVRAAWLARLAAARSCDGDVLGLARWRDRLIRRLHERGPGLDLDEPSFLRFRGTASAERFQTARDWLGRVREPVVAWVKSHATAAQLEWAGLSAETKATEEYAQLMLAWGLGVLGERARSRDWSARARKALAGVKGARIDPAGHAFLGDLFLHRIKEAHEGHAPKAALPADLQARYEKLPEFARYSADRLRDHCRILEPVGQGRAYRGLELREFFGTDRLGERLAVLGTRNDPAELHDEARALLATAAQEPTTATVPRVALALLQVAPALDAPALRAVLDLVPTALNWVEAWVSAGRWREAERADRVARYQCRLIEGAVAVAPLDFLADLLEELTHGALAGTLLPAVLATAPRVFRAARKFGLAGAARALVRALDPDRAAARGPVTAEHVGLAVGWFAAGDEGAGFDTLNAAREALFAPAEQPVRDRTALALAYAEALGFAPGVIALGRLEEMFQRVGRVTVHGSSNCYYTLNPLRLIDTAVRSVVTDDFTLGTTVRAWLDADEFLIRTRVHRDMATQLRESGLG